MVNQDKRLPDCPSQEAHGAIIALSPALEVAEAAELERFKLWIWDEY